MIETSLLVLKVEIILMSKVMMSKIQSITNWLFGLAKSLYDIPPSPWAQAYTIQARLIAQIVL